MVSRPKAMVSRRLVLQTSSKARPLKRKTPRKLLDSSRGGGAWLEVDSFKWCRSTCGPRDMGLTTAMRNRLGPPERLPTLAVAALLGRISFGACPAEGVPVQHPNDFAGIEAALTGIPNSWPSVMGDAACQSTPFPARRLWVNLSAFIQVPRVWLAPSLNGEC